MFYSRKTLPPTRFTDICFLQNEERNESAEENSEAEVKVVASDPAGLLQQYITKYSTSLSANITVISDNFPLERVEIDHP